jgi:hypothetical protein
VKTSPHNTENHYTTTACIQVKFTTIQPKWIERLYQAQFGLRLISESVSYGVLRSSGAA